MTNGYAKAQESYNSEQEKALEKVIKLNEQIDNVKDEISKILIENGLNILDVEKYEHDKNFDKFANMKLG